MDAEDLVNGGILDAARVLREHGVTVRDLVTASLARISSIGEFNAYTEVYADRALDLADAQQTLLDNEHDLGPLHGLPMSIKDNIDLAGTVTTAGGKVLRDVRPTDSAVVGALKRAGVIIVGKTNMHEFAWGGTTANPFFGSARNAWDMRRSPSGSSGGAGTAVARRTVFASIGTDTGGSVRNPAAVNGVSGIRPTIGRVSNRGVFPLASSLDVVGPLAKSSEDCAIVLDVIAGHDRNDPRTSTRPVPDYLVELGLPLPGVRIGLIDGHSVERVQPAVRKAFEEALVVFESLGAKLVELRIPHADEIVDALVVLTGVEASALHADWLRDRAEDYGADVRARLEAGLAFSAADYVQARRYRDHMSATFDAAFGKVDTILTPTLPFTAPLIGQDRIEIDGHHYDVHENNMRFTAFASVPGLPAMNVPAGFDDDGLPVGLQIIGPSFGEGAVLRVGRQLQAVTHHHLQAPRSSSCGSTE